MLNPRISGSIDPVEKVALTPPDNPTNGIRVLVADPDLESSEGVTATGVFAGHESEVAIFDSSVWQFEDKTTYNDKISVEVRIENDYWLYLKAKDIFVKLSANNALVLIDTDTTLEYYSDGIGIDGSQYVIPTASVGSVLTLPALSSANVTGGKYRCLVSCEDWAARAQWQIDNPGVPLYETTGTDGAPTEDLPVAGSGILSFIADITAGRWRVSTGGTSTSGSAQGGSADGNSKLPEATGPGEILVSTDAGDPHTTASNGGGKSGWLPKGTAGQTLVMNAAADAIEWASEGPPPASEDPALFIGLFKDPELPEAANNWEQTLARGGRGQQYQHMNEAHPGFYDNGALIPGTTTGETKLTHDAETGTIFCNYESDYEISMAACGFIRPDLDNGPNLEGYTVAMRDDFFSTGTTNYGGAPSIVVLGNIVVRRAADGSRDIIGTAPIQIDFQNNDQGWFQGTLVSVSGSSIMHLLPNDQVTITMAWNNANNAKNYQMIVSLNAGFQSSSVSVKEMVSKILRKG